jgi:hypothetical protein
VHNITFIVDNMDETMSAIEGNGVKDLFTFPLDWGELVGVENVKANVPPVHMVDTMDLLGFHLELGERPSEKKMDILYVDYE